MAQRATGVAAVLAAALVAWGAPAHAQLNPFRLYTGPRLSSDDVAAGRAAMGRLLREGPATVGRSERWTGAKSGDNGTLTIRRVFERKGMPCREVASEVHYRQRPDVHSLTLTTCQVPSGQWKLAD